MGGSGADEGKPAPESLERLHGNDKPAPRTPRPVDTRPGAIVCSA
jgi:hypothetical protein